MGDDMSNRQFAERLNQELDIMEMPPAITERTNALARLLKITKFEAGLLINGSIPNNGLLTRVAGELEVNPEWLTGKSIKRVINPDNVN
tara:strand:+ start:426 stop:692 length:267 start_codon:yes stop_codon:yes gene_type:complete